MRKISANYIFPVSSAPLKNGILVLDDDNRITDIINTSNNFKEIENLEYYGGIIVPGFVDAFCLLSWANLNQQELKHCINSGLDTSLPGLLSNKHADNKNVQRSINHLEAFGTKGAADLFPSRESKALKDNSKLCFAGLQTTTNYLLPDEEGYTTNSSIVLINRYSIGNYKLSCQSGDYCIGTGSLGTHQKLSIFDEMKWIQNQFPQITIWEITKWASLNSAKKLNLEKDLGSLQIGKKPGLNLIEGIDFENSKLLPQSKLKVLI